MYEPRLRFHRKRVVAALLLAVALGASVVAAAFAAPGDLDTTFSGDGKVTTRLSFDYDGANGVAIQTDGKIVAAGRAWIRGTATFGLVRYNRNGSLDTTFSNNGKVKTAFAGGASANDVAIQTNGKIVAAGGFANIVAAGGTGRSFALARYNPNGTLDATFSGNGKVTTTFGSTRYPWYDSAEAVAIQADGKIVAVGWADHWSTFALARYNRNGTLDTTFGGDGKVRTSFSPTDDASAYGVAIQADGKIVAVGDDWTVGARIALARYNRNGSLDTTFGGDGKVTTDFGGARASAVAIQGDGKIVVAGCAGYIREFAVARYKSDGSLDTTFGGDGTVTTDFTAGDDEASGVAIQADGKIVAVGWANDEPVDEDIPGDWDQEFALARYDASGTLDTTFGGDGRVTTDFVVDDYADAVAIQSNGRIVAAGGTGHRFALARYLAE